MILTILVFLLVLSVLVLIHEAGHYFVAKWLKIKVEEFGFGFPPKALSIKKGETEYSINWLPIGGFVKLYGEDEAGAGRIQSSKLKVQSSDVHRAFFSRSVGQRASVVVAGVVMNLLLAIVIFYVLLSLSGYKMALPKIGDYQFVGANQITLEGVIVGNISKNSPAEKIGINPPVKILSLNGNEMQTPQEFIDLINNSKGKEVTLSWIDLKTNITHTKKVIPRVSPPKNEGALGVQLDRVAIPTVIISYDTYQQRLMSGITHTFNLIPFQINAIGSLISKSLEQKQFAPVGDAVGGPIAIGFVVGDVLSLPDFRIVLYQLLNLAGFLSVSLAFFNVLPIPALDGGRLFFILIEGISGKKINRKYEDIAHQIGMIALLTFILVVTLKDINKYILPYLTGLNIF